jgi:hypothetical protein
VLQDISRKGRPRIFKETERLEIMALACEPLQVEGRRTPTIDEVRERALKRKIVPEISRAQIHRILQAGEIRPHRIRMWLHSPDPNFRELVNEICDLYHNPPENMLIIIRSLTSRAGRILNTFATAHKA